MKRFIAAALVAIATFALSGCSVGGDDRPVPANASPRASAPASAAPAPPNTPAGQPSLTASPTPAPSADSGWRFTVAGYGPITLNSDSTAALTDALFVKDASVQGQCIDLWHWSSGDINKTHQQEWDLTVGQVQNHVRYIYATAQRAQVQPAKITGEATTDAGITFGSTVAELRAAYPGIRKTQDTWNASYGGYREWVTGSPGAYLVFQSTGGPDESHDWVWSIRAATTDDHKPLC